MMKRRRRKGGSEERKMRSREVVAEGEEEGDTKIEVRSGREGGLKKEEKDQRRKGR